MPSARSDQVSPFHSRGCHFMGCLLSGGCSGVFIKISPRVRARRPVRKHIYMKQILQAAPEPGPEDRPEKTPAPGLLGFP